MYYFQLFSVTIQFVLTIMNAISMKSVAIANVPKTRTWLGSVKVEFLKIQVMLVLKLKLVKLFVRLTVTVILMSYVKMGNAFWMKQLSGNANQEFLQNLALVAKNSN